MDRIFRHSRGVEGFGLVTSRLHFCFSEMAVSFINPWSPTLTWVFSSRVWSVLGCELAPSNLRLCQSIEKECYAFSRSWRRSCSYWRSLGILRSSSQVTEEWGRRLTGRSVQRLQSCGLSISLWWIRSWDETWSSQFTRRSTFLPSAMVTSCELWHERARFRIEVAKISFFRRVSRLSLRKAQSSEWGSE